MREPDGILDGWAVYRVAPWWYASHGGEAVRSTTLRGLQRQIRTAKPGQRAVSEGDPKRR